MTNNVAAKCEIDYSNKYSSDYIRDKNKETFLPCLKKNVYDYKTAGKQLFIYAMILFYIFVRALK